MTNQADLWLKKLDQNTDNFKAAFGQLNEAQLNWKPNPETWSIGQNIDHLIVINSTYFPVFDTIASGTYKNPFLGQFGFITNFFGKFILNSVRPETEKKIKTFPIWEPAKSEISTDILARFEQHQETLKGKIKALPSISGIVIGSPANKNIIYKLEAALDIITTHEERHLKNAKRILALQQKQA